MIAQRVTRKKPPEVEMALIKPVPYGLPCRSKPCTEHPEAPKSPDSVPTGETSPSSYGGKQHLLVCLLVCSIYSHSYEGHPRSICMPTGARSGFLGEAPSLFSSSALEVSAKEGIKPPAACSAPVRDCSLLPSQDTSTQEHKIIKWAWKSLEIAMARWDVLCLSKDFRKQVKN